MTIEITPEMVEAGINATGKHHEMYQKPVWKCGVDVQVIEIYKAMEEARLGHIIEADIKRPNASGDTQCIVRYMVETPHGWVGSWDIESIKHLAGLQFIKD